MPRNLPLETPAQVLDLHSHHLPLVWGKKLVTFLSRVPEAPHLGFGTSKGLLPILKKLSEWFEDEELEDLASASPGWEGRRSSEGCGRFQSTLCGEDEQLFLLQKSRAVG
jgi:hypothetical protein